MLSELSALKFFRVVYGSTPQFGTSSRSHVSPQVGPYRLELGSQLWFPSQTDARSAQIAVEFLVVRGR